MKAPFSISQCRISTLSPLHLGCGEDYLPTHYVIQNDYLHAYGDQQLLQALGPQGLTRLLHIVESGKPDAILNARREVLNHADRLVPLASHSVWVANGVARLYQDRVVSVAQRETDRHITNELAIQRTYSNPFNHQPVLPGSAVKGAIRTAWLNRLNKGANTQRGEKSQALEQRLLEKGRKVEEDPFYLLKVADAGYHSPHQLKAGEIWFAVSRKRQPHPDRQPSNLNTLLECIGPGRDRCFGLDIRFLDGSLRGGSRLVPLNQKELIDACNLYYVPKLLKELNQLGEQAGYLAAGWVSGLKTLLAGELGQALQQGQAMLLRLGKHSGAEDKTLDGARSIRIKTPKGQDDKFLPHTTEVRLAAQTSQQPTALLPFGWVLVEFEHTPPLPGVRTLLADLSEPARARQGQEQQQESARQQALAEQALAAQRAREQAEAAARAAEEQARRQAELASLPPQMQAMAALREAMDANPAARGEGPTGVLYQQLRELAMAATDWPKEHRLACRELVADAFAFLGIDRKKNKKAKELWSRLGEGS